MVEKAPEIGSVSPDILDVLTDSSYQSVLETIEKKYLYWDKAKYYVPKGLDSKIFWSAVRFQRLSRSKFLKFGTYNLSFYETSHIQQLLHEFDMNFGGTLISSNLLSEKNRRQYLLSSIMEEAIASSQMEGASTTRKVAKEMLKKQLRPKDTSQQMILNNYNTIRFLSEHREEKLTPELILEIHRQITEKTLENSDDEGRFRLDDSICVMNGITGEVAYEPPSHTKISGMIKSICKFANDDENYIHPIVKAVIIHFMISFLHPFVDGNGRTARSLFYWFMLKKGYWLTEFLSISRIIYRSKAQYEKAFLYTESDGNDLGYFIQYNLEVLKKSYGELQKYLERKSSEQNALLEFKEIPGLNERQAKIVKTYVEKPNSIFVSKDFETTFNVSVKTIRSDLEGLVKMGILETVPMNRRLVGYARSKDFEFILMENREN